MTEAQAVEAITQAFITGWTALHHVAIADAAQADYCPIALEGENLDAPTTWVRMSIVADDRAQRSMGPAGSRRVLSTGNIAVQVFTDVNLGTKARATLCDEVRSVLELRNIDVAGELEPVRVYAGASRNPSTDGRWLIGLVVLAYEYQSTNV